MENVKRTKVVDLLKSTAYGSIVNVKGWVRTHRSSKAVDFIALNDGSTINNIQIVCSPPSPYQYLWCRNAYPPQHGDGYPHLLP